jgi:hypothetical protein
MSGKVVTRGTILEALVGALEPQPHVHALWEGGSEAFRRTDLWSDLDVQVDVDDERVSDTLARIEGVLESLSPIQNRLEAPPGPEDGYIHVFYRLRDTSEFLLVDLCVMRHSYPDKFLEPQIHGKVVIHFNKGDTLVVRPLNVEQHLAKIGSRQEKVERRFAMFYSMVEKELNRQNHIAAIDLYHRLVLDSLVDALRMLHSPAHFDFKVPYLNHDLPRDVLDRLQPLFFVADADDLRRKYQDASRWFRRTLQEIDLAAAEAKLRSL